MRGAYLQVGTLALAVIISGCIPGPNGLGVYNGPPPVISASSAAASTRNYLAVRDVFIRRAGYGSSATVVDWYEVSLAGFSYVDEQCTAYLSALQDLRRSRDHIRNQIAAVGTTTGAILGVTGVTTQAIAITAAAFGLASQITENATASLLYAMDPSDIQDLVRNQSQAYRMGVAAQRANYVSQNAAMDAVRGYLNLCLPVSIEAQVKAAVKNTAYIATPTSFGVPSLTQVSTGDSAVQASVIIPSQQALRDDPVQRPKQPEKSKLAAGLMAGDLPNITRIELEEIQKRLCVRVDGNFGPDKSETREALREVQAKFGGTAPTGRLDAATRARVHGLALCDAERHRNTFEHLYLTTEEQVNVVQTRLLAFAKSHQSEMGDVGPLTADADFVGGDRLNSKNRAVIETIEVKILKGPGTGALTSAVDLLIQP